MGLRANITALQLRSVSITSAMRSAAAMAVTETSVTSPAAILLLALFFSHFLTLTVAAGARCPSQSILITLAEPYLEISSFDFVDAQFAALTTGTRSRDG